MRNMFLLIIFVLLISSPVVAWDNKHNEQEKKSIKEYPYESITGTRYKYDLSNPSDRIRYEVDPAAQLRDSINPRVDIDRGLGQYGGGAK